MRSFRLAHNDRALCRCDIRIPSARNRSPASDKDKYSEPMFGDVVQAPNKSPDADGRHCLQPKKNSEIYDKKSANQCSSNAGKPAGFIFTPNKSSQTNTFFIGATLFKTKLVQQLKLAWRKMLLMEVDYF